MIKRFFKNFSSLNKFKTSINIPKQNINWTVEELNSHVNALKNSFNSLNVKKNDEILFWLDENHISEGVITKLAASDFGLKVNQVSNYENLKTQLKGDKNKFLFISPNEEINLNGNNIKKVDILYDLLPELKNSKSNYNLNLNSNKNLNYIIQTGFYQLNGITKFKDILNYTKRKIVNNSEETNLKKLLQKDIKKLKINDENIIIIGNPLEDLLFNIGPLNSLINSIKTTIINNKDISNQDLSFLNQFEESTLVCNKEIEDNIKGSYLNEKIKKIII